MKPSPTRDGQGGRKRTGLVAAAALAFPCLFFLLAAPSPALAATYTVTNLLNSGAGSLRAAVLAANATPDADTVAFAPALTGTITLTTGEIPVTGVLTITGPGYKLLVVSGNAASRVFNIGTGAAVSISGLRLTGGNAQKGGAVLFAGKGLHLTSCKLDLNTAYGGAAGDGGGALYASGGKVTLDSCVIGENAANLGEGGGLHFSGTAAVLARTTISGNTSQYSGGGLRVAGGGSVTLTGCTVASNAAGGTGGGVAAEVATLRMTDTVLSGNTTPTNGGGVWLLADPGATEGVTATRCIMTGNTANLDGGGLYVSGPGDLADCAVSGNTAGESGGGVYNDYGPFAMSGSTISGNTAQNIAGGLLLAPASTLLPTLVMNSTISGNTSGSHAGGVFNIRASTFVSCTITGNTCGADPAVLADGGGLFEGSPGGGRLKNTVLAGNLNAGSTWNPDCSDGAPGLVSLGGNLVGMNGQCDSVFPQGWPNADGDIVGAWPTAVDAVLGPLSTNGGATLTHAPLPASPALALARDCTDADGTPLAADQRGVARPQGAYCDSGSFERVTRSRSLPATAFPLLGE